jgi:hypothetical protein
VRRSFPAGPGCSMSSRSGWWSTKERAGPRPATAGTGWRSPARGLPRAGPARPGTVPPSGQALERRRVRPAALDGLGPAGSGRGGAQPTESPPAGMTPAGMVPAVMVPAGMRPPGMTRSRRGSSRSGPGRRPAGTKRTGPPGRLTRPDLTGPERGDPSRAGRSPTGPAVPGPRPEPADGRRVGPRSDSPTMADRESTVPRASDLRSGRRHRARGGPCPGGSGPAGEKPRPRP